MADAPRPRILVVDDEEAILETMTFTFEDDYEVHTSTDARRALEILDEHAPIAVVLTDQRMPNMSGVEFLREVWQRHPATMRIILTGFADMGAIIEAINDGHVYAYIAKPWEPDHLKQVMKQAVNHHQLTRENERLLTELKHANVFLGAIMDHLDTGALAMDASGVIQAVNRAARAYLALEGDPLGKPLQRVLRAHDLRGLAAAIDRLASDATLTYDEADVTVADRSYRVRVAVHNLADASGEMFGRVVLLREISHEPFRRDFERLMARIVEAEGELRPILESARDELRRLGEQVESLHLDSAGVGELTDRLSRTRTAIENWLDVDDAVAQESYPDAQRLQARMRVALARWPMPDRVPERVRLLAQQVEEYYESGENPQRHVL